MRLATALRTDADVERFTIDRPVKPFASTLPRDVRRGFAGEPKALPPKYFYDARGSELFEQITELPEYYLTRAERGLLETHARDIMARSAPLRLIELGAGSSRKTRILLDAARDIALVYQPLDVCAEIMCDVGAELLAEYPALRVHAVVADYERELARVTPGSRRLVAFLGSTLGNLPPERERRLFRRLGDVLRPGEHLLLGADLVKPRQVLEPAYDDAAGVTAEFNKNLLLVLNRELDADFDPADFRHVAFFNAALSQVEMHLEAKRALTVRFAKLDWSASFTKGERLHTEVSRKFTVEGLETSLARGGFRPIRWYLPEGRELVLVLAERA